MLLNASQVFIIQTDHVNQNREYFEYYRKLTLWITFQGRFIKTDFNVCYNIQESGVMELNDVKIEYN